MQGKIVLVTGAAKRIGATIAQHLHAAGATVIIHYHHSADAADELAAQLNATRAGSADIRQADLRDVSTIQPLIDSILSGYGRLDALINNASTFYPTKIGTISLDDWEDLMGTNLRAPLFLSQAAAAALRTAGGVIINLVDVHAKRPLQDHNVYCAAKAGLDMLTRSLARELGPEIRVNGVAPGPILWPTQGLTDAAREKIIAATALKRSGEPADIARTVLFLLRDAGYITGQIIAVDGGRSL